MRIATMRLQLLKERTKQILEFKNKINELIILLEGFKNRLEQAEERVSELKDRSFDIMEWEAKRKNKKSDQNLRDLWDTIKWSSIHIIGEEEINYFEEIINENLTNLKNNMNIEVQEA